MLFGFTTFLGVVNFVKNRALRFLNEEAGAFKDFSAFSL